ncbi:MAG TPA: nitrous oxide-stimulated promoter family protein [Paludibacter sp.]
MDKIAYDKIIVGHMIDLYCRKKHKGEGLCAGCEQLKQYALERLTKCPLGADKTACTDCKVHCYKNDMRGKIRQVMRFSGPRIFFYYPKDAFLHFNKKQTLKN